jgi:Cupin superfamily protein
MPYSEAVLGPGDALYIPRWTWHFVQAIDAPSARIRAKELEECTSGCNVFGFSDIRRLGSGFQISNLGPGPGQGQSGRGHRKRKNSIEAVDGFGVDDEEVPHCFSISFWWGERREKDADRGGSGQSHTHQGHLQQQMQHMYGSSSGSMK